MAQFLGSNDVREHGELCNRGGVIMIGPKAGSVLESIYSGPHISRLDGCFSQGVRGQGERSLESSRVLEKLEVGKSSHRKPDCSHDGQ